jgi:hypothetical protein
VVREILDLVGHHDDAGVLIKHALEPGGAAFWGANDNEIRSGSLGDLIRAVRVLRAVAPSLHLRADTGNSVGDLPHEYFAQPACNLRRSGELTPKPLGKAVFGWPRSAAY